MYAFVISYAKRFARLVGYDPTSTKSARVPIVSAYLKTRLASGVIVLLLVHEAPYLAHSPTTLLSEYQIRQHGLVVDSCSIDHVLCSDPLLYGKKRLELGNLDGGPTRIVNLLNRGGI